MAKYIAKNYGFYHLDSGILYRRITFLIIKNRIDVKKNYQLIPFLKTLSFISPRKHKILRKEMISKRTSEIATITVIRNFINKQQRLIIKNIFKSYKGCVVDGRDIGSKVFKNAQIKLFIDVKTKIRAKRRHKQLIEQGEKSIYTHILKDINLRDKIDKSRTSSPLVIPHKAIIIDNSFSFKKTIIQINRALRVL